jgi:hypothetical protein
LGTSQLFVEGISLEKIVLAGKISLELLQDVELPSVDELEHCTLVCVPKYLPLPFVEVQVVYALEWQVWTVR